MGEFPDSVWIRSRITEDGRTIVERCPFGNARGVGTVKYIRADIAAERIAELEAALAEAIEDIDDWGSYADDYFREKHDLQGCLEKHRAKLDAQEKDDEL